MVKGGTKRPAGGKSGGGQASGRPGEPAADDTSMGSKSGGGRKPRGSKS